MDCEALESQLIDYLKDELAPGEREVVDAHLAGCEACRTELHALEATFDVLRRELVPIELSAHFRMALADRLDEATQATLAAAPAHKAVRASERHIREMRRPTLVKFWDHARRSPYFAVSLLLHAAAFCIIIAILVKTQTEQPPQMLNPDVEAAIEQNRVLRDPGFQAFQRRADAPVIRTRAVAVAEGMQVDLAQFMVLSDETLVLVGDNELNCVQGFVAGGEDTPSVETLISQHPGASVERMEKAKVTIPQALGSYFKPSLELFVFRLNGRYEFWSQPTWNQLRKRFRNVTLAACPVEWPVPLAALLQRQRPGVA